MDEQDVNGIPIVDFSIFRSGKANDEARIRAAKDFVEKCHRNGCVGIKGHGVPSTVIQRAFTITKSLFDLPYEDKMKAPHPEGNTPHRGYSSIGREQGAAKTATETNDEAKKKEYITVKDYKESYEIGSEENKVQYNIWLPEDTLPGFRDFMTDFFWELHRFSSRIVDCIAIGLGLEDAEIEVWRSLHTGHNSQIRLLHYPPIAPEELRKGNIGRLGAHADWSTFTLLFQQDQGGLEFLDKASDSFMPAEPRDGTVYLNSGDMLMRLSNNYIPATYHRVTTNGGAKANTNDISDTKGITNGVNTAIPARYSIPFFVAPLADEIIDPPPSLVKAHGKKEFEPVTFNSYSETMFNMTNIRDAK